MASPLPDDRLTADDITRSGLRADVVVLSGCATGDGRELRGEGVLGLTYGFLANGSNAVVASLWPVEDALTARFMEEFYAAYRTSGRAADALRVAQLRTRGIAGPLGVVELRGTVERPALMRRARLRLLTTAPARPACRRAVARAGQPRPSSARKSGDPFVLSVTTSRFLSPVTCLKRK